MKKLIVCLTTILALFGCEQPNTQSNTTNNQEQQKPKTLSLEEIEEQQLNSRIRKDTIIEGLVFGMTRKQVIEILSQLKKEYKVKEFASNDEDNSIIADYNIGVDYYIAKGLMDLRFYNNQLFLCRIYFKEKMNKPLYTLSDDFLKLYKEKFGEFQFKRSGIAGTMYVWVTGNRSVSIGDMQDPNDPYYIIEYKDTGFKEAWKSQQENIDKKKPKI